MPANFELVNIVCHLPFDVLGIVIVLATRLFFNVNLLIDDDAESNETCYWLCNQFLAEFRLLKLKQVFTKYMQYTMHCVVWRTLLTFLTQFKYLKISRFYITKLK